MSLGDRIKARRVELGWTQDVLARKAGISKGFLSDVENAKRSVRADTLLDIARVLSRSLDFLMTGDDTDKGYPKEVEIPASLAVFAEQEELSFRRTLMLLDIRRRILAHRSTSGKEALDQVDWQQFFESVKDFM